ncbi:MAG: hypothetical protein EHM65_03485 [Acidobacteriales bacterium]|nr:MAG: hypothetical protein EHM65_03485 [Terriglobales bacterium]
MKRKLLLLNLALLVLVAAAGWQLRLKWIAGKAQERRVLQPVSKPPVPSTAGLPQAPPPANAGGYAEVAQKVLFSKDRNPNVVVEVAPPKPVPAFPTAHGVMNLGSGPVVLLSEKAGVASRGYSIGEKVGEFMLVALEGDELLLEWDGKQFKKRLQDLKPQPGTQVAAKVAAPAATGPVAPTVSASAPVVAGPDAKVSEDLRSCVPGDTTPAGTVRDGYRKVVTQTPFGNACRWELVK